MRCQPVYLFRLGPYVVDKRRHLLFGVFEGLRHTRLTRLLFQTLTIHNQGVRIMSDSTFTDPPEHQPQGQRRGFSGQVASFMVGIHNSSAQILVIAVAWDGALR